MSFTDGVKIVSPRNFLKRDSSIFQVLKALFGGGSLNMSGPCHMIYGVPQTLQTAMDRKLIRLNDEKYVLTEFGKWHVIADVLSISVTELYVLASAYCTQKAYEKSNLRGIYITHDFSALLGGSYSDKYVFNLFSNLIRTGLVSRLGLKAIYLTRQQMKQLSPYDTTLEKLYAYLQFLKTASTSDILEGKHNEYRT